MLINFPNFLQIKYARKSSILVPSKQYFCDCQFDEKSKFKQAVNEMEPEQMRIQPIGRDKMGLVYWFQKVFMCNCYKFCYKCMYVITHLQKSVVLEKKQAQCNLK